jgi:hypothetical protein
MSQMPQMTVKIENENQVSIEYVVNEANKIYKDMKKSKITFGDMEAAAQLMREMQQKYSDFCMSYPIVNRYICQMQEYDTKTFRLWLKKIQRTPWKTESEYLDAQADYVVMLFRCKKPRAPMTEVSTLRQNIRIMLQREHEQFTKCAKDIQEEVNIESEQYHKQNIAGLTDFVTNIKGAASEAETIRVELDDSVSVAAAEIDIDKLASVFGENTAENHVNSLLD